MKLLVHTANLGDFYRMTPHAPQSIPYDYHIFNDTNSPPRSKAMAPTCRPVSPNALAGR